MLVCGSGWYMWYMLGDGLLRDFVNKDIVFYFDV